MLWKYVYNYRYFGAPARFVAFNQRNRFVFEEMDEN